MQKNKITNKILFFTILLLLSNSCIGFKFGGKKGTKQYYKEFFLKGGIIQYFIKPIKFKGKKEQIIIDFTFRDTVQKTSNIIVNYTITSPEITKKIDSIFFIYEKTKIELKNIERFYIEKQKSMYLIRYSSVITYADLIKITTQQPNILAYFNNNKHKFYITKKAKKVLSVSKEQIVDIIELNR